MHEKIAKFIKFAENHWYKNNINLHVVSSDKNKFKAVSNFKLEVISPEFVDSLLKWLRIKWYTNKNWYLDDDIFLLELWIALHNNELVKFIDWLWLWI